MDDLATLTAQPKTITIDGKDYKVHPLDLGDFGALQAWVDRQFPDPLQVAKKAIAAGGFNMAQQQLLLKEALLLASRCQHKIGTLEADELIRSVDGMKYTLYLTIRKGDPSFTEEDAEALFAKMDFIDLAGFGQASTVDMVAGDPKAKETPETPPS